MTSTTTPRTFSSSSKIFILIHLSFLSLDSNLYLDNHPDDKNAINTYNSLCNQFAQARYAYENKYGPLTNFG
ncbi:spore coat protein CotJB, partial [Clostridioides difficile]|uniref:spore coat protein CotJB n=1 Tax=Clostridioides difficile TaxID=1496 RepID=UPI003F8D799A